MAMDTGQTRHAGPPPASVMAATASSLYAIVILSVENGRAEEGFGMAMAAEDRNPARAGRCGALAARFPSICAWMATSLLLAICHFVGYSPNSDTDDLLKLVEIRNFLQTGAWFDRTIPSILQPEPFVSHWVRLVDLPYAVVAAPLAPLIGRETALSIACYIVPLLLLLPAIYAFRRIVATLGLERPNAVFFISFLFVLPALFEFAPDRIDYHNLELVFLLLAVAYTLAPQPPALLVGVLSAATLAISVEFALFFLLLMAVFAASFILDQEDADRRLSRLGAGLAGTALLLYASIVPPGHYGVVACDTYSTPHLMGLVSAGVTFIAAGALSGRIHGPVGRIAFLGALAAVSVTALIILFPECRAGPYGELSSYVKNQWLASINQEKNILQRPDIVLAPDMAGITILMISALAPITYALRDRLRSRELVIFALFCLLALLHMFFYLRYFRYTAFFVAPAMTLVFAACVPSLTAKGGVLAGRITRSLPPRLAVLGPGLILTTGLVAFHLTTQNNVRAEPPPSGADFAGDCRLSDSAPIIWPSGADIFAPPDLGIRILAAETTLGRITIVATPHHPSWRGIERFYRFLDPRTPDPRQYLDQSGATHVAVCAWRGRPLAKLEKSNPLTAALLEGHPPSWLLECPLPASSPIRVYRYPNAGGALDACPTAAPLSAG
jgi:hypothetical protein